MRKLICIAGILVVMLFVISVAMAETPGRPQGGGGVEVSVIYDPLGSNNTIVAFVRFINSNNYKVRVNWEPVMTCSGTEKKGYGEPFEMDAGGSYQVNIWRSQACQDRKLEHLRVEMHVNKITGY